MRMFANVVVVSLVLGAASSAAAQNDFQWRGQIASGQTLEIKGINGDIHAVASSSGDAEVTATKSAQRSNPADVRIQVMPRGGGVTICAVYPNMSGQDCEMRSDSDSRNRNNDTSVRFEVRVPAGVKFVGRTVNGSVDGESLSGDAEGHTVNGSVRLSTAGVAIGNTVNGSLNLTMGRADWPGGAKFSTVNGEITLRLPSFANANLRASVLNGTIESEFPITTTGTISRRRIEGTIGSGGQDLTLSTVNGSIKLLKSE
jgi:putative adhesin